MRQHRHRRRPHRRGARAAIRTSTRSPSPARPKWAASSAAPPPAAASASRWSWAANRRSSSSTMPISTASSKAWSTPSGSTRARSAAPARGCWCRKASPTRCIAKLRARMEKLRVGDPLDKAVDIGAIVAPVQLEQIQRLVQQGVAEGATLWQPSWACPTDGYFFPPTLFTDVLAGLDHRAGGDLRAGAGRDDLPHARRGGGAGQQHPLRPGRQRLEREHQPRARRGRARSRPAWSGSTAPTMFDAASGFGGYRESGFGREGGREGLYEYLQPAWEAAAEHAERAGRRRPTAAIAHAAAPRSPTRPRPPRTARMPSLTVTRTAATAAVDSRRRLRYAADRPHGQAVHRRQAGAARLRLQPRGATAQAGEALGEVGEGNRKDIRNAVEAAHKAAAGWASATAHNRAQILYYIAENLAVRAESSPRASRDDRLLAGRCATARWRPRSSGSSPTRAWADKYDGAVHRTPLPRHDAGDNEPIGVIGIVCPDERPLLGFVSLVAPAIAMGNTVVAIPSEHHPLSATDFYSGAGDLGRAGGRGQHRHRRARRAGAGAGRARRRRCDLVLRHRRGRARRSKMPPPAT